MATDSRTVLVWLGFLGLFLGLLVFNYVHGRRRREAFRTQAKALGLEYEATSSEGLETRLGHLSLFGRGRSRRCRNVLKGTYRTLAIRAFDYHFTTGGGKHKQHHIYGVAVARVPVAGPGVSIVPETWDKKLWDAIGGDDIDFESDEFSRRFWVKASDRRFAYDLVHPRMMEFLLAPGWSSWELAGADLCLYQVGFFDPKKLSEVLDRLVGFVDLVPSRLRAGPGEQMVRERVA